MIYINPTDVSFLLFLHTIPLESLHVQCDNIPLNQDLVIVSFHLMELSYHQDFVANYLFIRCIVKYYVMKTLTGMGVYIASNCKYHNIYDITIHQYIRQFRQIDNDRTSLVVANSSFSYIVNFRAAVLSMDLYYMSTTN